MVSLLFTQFTEAGEPIIEAVEFDDLHRFEVYLQSLVETLKLATSYSIEYFKTGDRTYKILNGEKPVMEWKYGSLG